jgi:hypothetical protein
MERICAAAHICSDDTHGPLRVLSLLFPVRLVDFEAIKAWECFDADTAKDLATEIREYSIPDFTVWKDHDAFEAAVRPYRRDRATRRHKRGLKLCPFLFPYSALAL